MVSAFLLEGILRLTAPILPGRLVIGAQAVLSGELYFADTLDIFTLHRDHNFVALPDLDNAVHVASPTVKIHVTTSRLWDSPFGFRNRPVNYAVDAIVVGDSFSFCITEEADCWVRRFEAETGLGVVNLAQVGTGSMSHWRMIDIYGRPFEPRLVLWQWWGNDFNEDYFLAVERGEIEAIFVPDPPILPQVSDNPLVQWLRTHSVAFAVSEVALGNERPYIDERGQLFIAPYRIKQDGLDIRFGQAYEQRAFDLDNPRNAAGVALTREALRLARDAVSEWGGTFAVIVLPTREEVYAPLTAPVMGDEALGTLVSARETMLGLCEELDLLCLDTLPQLQQLAQQNIQLYYSDDLHLNPRGNAELSRIVWGWLGGEGLLYE